MQLPAAPPLLQDAASFIKRHFQLWRAAAMIKALGKDEEAHMRQKVLAYTLFKGNKPFNVTRRFDADYLEASTNPNQKAYIAAMQRLFQKFGDTRVEFADYADKINRGQSVQRRGSSLRLR